MKQKERVREGDETLDAFFHGRILVLQKKRGYRFSVDAPLLADFIQTHKTDECLELGTGSGIVSLLLSIKRFNRITAVEIQDTLCDLAVRNICLNHLEDRIQVVHGDLRTFRPGTKYDVIFSNPPYIRSLDGHLSASEEKSIAKHELKCDIFGIMQKTAELLKPSGRSFFVYIQRRREDFEQAVRKSRLRMATVREVHPRQGEEANLFLAACDFAARAETRMSPLVLYEEDDRYTPEAEAIFTGRIHATTD